MKAFLIDVAKCNGCHNCQISCKDERCGTEWMPYAADQPMTGHFWCKVEEKVRGSVPVVRVSYTPLVCGHCDDAPCAAAAKDGAVYRHDDGLVVIDPAKAKGQRAIMDACPMGAIYWNEELNLPQKCTGGCLVDFDSREVVVDAEAVLVDEAGTEVARVPTDDFGDFLFDQVEPAAYTVRVAGRELAADVREKDLNLGDIALR